MKGNKVRSGVKSVSVIGLGYIGLPTAAMFASRKVPVHGVDVNQAAVDTINRGEIHIVEPDLDIVVRAAVSEGYLKAATKAAPADAFLIAVPTPFKGDNKEPDLRFIEAAAQAIAPVLKKGDLVVLESTSPVGTTDKVAAWLAAARPDLTFPPVAGDKADIRMAYCPERVLPGRVMQELIYNDRIIGGMTPTCAEAAVKLYKKFVIGNCVVTNARTAEMAKLTENSFRDVNIAFANELSVLCDGLDINVWELISLTNRHPRVDILQPGPGVGGHCIAVDPWFIVSNNPEEARIIRMARDVNDGKPGWVVGKIREAVAASGKGAVTKIACYGLAFKANIDDVRESPAIEIVHALLAEKTGELLVVEPHISHLPKGLDGAKLVSFADASKAADIHVLLVDHRVFAEEARPEGVIVDTRGLWTR